MIWLVDADVKEPVIETGVVASGGTESDVSIGGQLYRVHEFTENGTLTVSTGGSVECLVVGGGGAGGQTVGSYSETFGSGEDVFVIATGGGGGGGVVRATIDLPSSGSYPITVGVGGQIDTTLAPNQAPSNTAALDGGDSKISFGGIDLVTSKGGGGGAINTRPADFTFIFNGRDGASGGGGFSSITFDQGASGGFMIGVATDGGFGILNQGNDGASGGVIEVGPGTLDDTAFAMGGGGGGSFLSGKIIDILIETDVLASQPSGGNGVQSDITGFVENYGGGGGGTAGGIGPTGTANYFGASGSGGGGNGARGFPITVASQAGANGFGGGGGCGYTIFTDIDSVGVESVQASNGGSGIVIIRYPLEG